MAGGVVALLAAGGAVAVALTREPPAVLSTAQTAKVDRGAVSLAVATSGTLSPARSYALGFGTAGTVTTLAVHAGDKVAKGQVLARIDDTAAKERVSSARDAVDRAGDALDAAESAGTATCGGRTVQSALRTTPTVPASPTPTARPSATARPGASQGTQSRPPATTAPSAGRTGGACTGSTEDPVLRARQQLTAAGVTLADAEDALAGTTIKAPVAGTVLSVSGAVGASVPAGSSVVTMADPATMQVTATFPEADAGRLAAGQTATVTLADRADAPLTANVVQVDPVGTTDGSLVVFGAQLAFEQAPQDVLVGQSAAVRVTVASRSDVLRVPSTAVRADDTVLVRDGAGDRATQVAVGLRGDAYTEITGGLIDGQEIVTASS
ncbi:efflux RND transporter periplasmic adaptor subunit [Asanoa iriomotensis]